MYTVYVVDDDPLILDEIVTTVPWLDNGFEVMGYASSSTTAIAEIELLKPDVVFSDLKMPGISGLEMIKQLRNRGLSCEYVMLSAYGTFEDSRDFFRLNGFDYLLKPFRQQEMQLLLERLAAKLARHRPRPVVSKMNPAFVDLTRYIANNFSQKHTLNSLSKKFGLSPHYICNLFAKHYNSTLTRYLTELRMKASLQMMRETGRPFKEIAIECGYGDYVHFCRAFKEFYGASPTTYLKSLNQIPGQGANGKSEAF